MKEQDRRELRAMVRTMYDYQDMRIRTAGRLRLNADDETVDTEHMDDAEISEKDYSAVKYIKLSSQKIEKMLAKEIKKIIESQPIWNKFFLNVRGCGPLMTGACLSEFNIHRAETVSKMWQFAGLNPSMIRGKKIIKITKKTDMSSIERLREYENKKNEKCVIILTDELIRGDKLKQGFVSPYNAWLRTKLCGVLASGMVKAQKAKGGKVNYALDFYYPYKTRLEQSENKVLHLGEMVPWKDVSKGHRDNAAKRYMIKMFIKDLYAVWRELEGLEVRVPYQEEYLGHAHTG